VSNITVSLRVLCVLLTLALCAIATPAEGTDELRLRNGTVIRGEFLAGDLETIVFRVDQVLQIYRKEDCAALFINGTGSPETPGSGTALPAAYGDGPTPGFSARTPFRIVRVITMRRVTQNRVVEDGRYEPEFARISDDGSTVAFFAPKSGLYVMNSDGGNRRLVFPTEGKDNAALENQRFALSPDGRVIFWQPGQSRPIYRINADGTDEQMLVNSGGEYDPNRLREGGRRIFFSARGGIFSIDTIGNGDYREIITPKPLAREWEVPEDWCLLGLFDASEDGRRIAFSVGGYPKAKARQLMGINADGTGLHRIVETEFEPWAISIAPDGGRVIFWKNTVQAYVVNWDGTGLTEIATPPWDLNGSGYVQFNRISPDGQWYEYNANEAGGFSQIVRIDSNGRYELQNYGPWDNHDNAIFHGMYGFAFSADLRHFVTVSQYWRGFKPRQVVVGEVNPATANGLPTITEIAFPATMSTNQQLPTNQGKITARIRKGTSDIERVQFIITPISQQRGDRWVNNAAVLGMRGDRIMHDDGKNGDATAGDGIYTCTTLALQSDENKLPPGHYLLRIAVHDEQNLVAVDVDGIEVK